MILMTTDAESMSGLLRKGPKRSYFSLEEEDSEKSSNEGLKTIVWKRAVATIIIMQEQGISRSKCLLTSYFYLSYD